VAGGAQRPQHRHHGRDATAGADQQDLLGQRIRQVEVPGRLLEVDEHAGMRALDQEVRDQAFGVGLDRQLQCALRARSRCGRIAARPAHAVDLDADLYELARAESLPGAIRSQRQGDAVGSQALHAGHLGAAIPPRPGRPDLLEEPVDPGRAGEEVEDAGAKEPLADAGSAGG
jgi:hypothetical protein